MPDFREISPVPLHIYNSERLEFSLKSPDVFLSLLFIITAFEWKFYDENEVMDLGVVASDFEDIIEVPPTEQPPTPQPKIVQPKIIEVPDEEEIMEEIEIDLDIEMTENQENREEIR